MLNYYFLYLLFAINHYVFQLLLYYLEVNVILWAGPPFLSRYKYYTHSPPAYIMLHASLADRVKGCPGSRRTVRISRHIQYYYFIQHAFTMYVTFSYTYCRIRCRGLTGVTDTCTLRRYDSTIFDFGLLTGEFKCLYYKL